MTRRRWRETGLAALFLAPSLIVFAAFFFYPLYRLVHMATHEQRAFSSRERFVGLDQVTEVLGSSEFLGSVQVSAAYVVYTVPLGLALGILLAVAADRHLRGIAVFRTIFASTVATSVAVASVLFFTLLNPQLGYFGDVSFISLADPDSALRGVALGRKAWLFAGSPRGGERAAFMYSLIVTARLNDIDPQTWLADVLARMPGLPVRQLADLLPWNWSERQRQAARAA